MCQTSEFFNFVAGLFEKNGPSLGDAHRPIHQLAVSANVIK
jgi:hypothetical protein